MTAKVDVLFRHQATGQLYVWFMDGTTQSSGDFLNPSALANASWQIRGLADFNGDAKADILWQNVTSGLLYVWTMDGTKRSEGVYPKPSVVSNPSWKIAQVADFNGDGKPDILWRHQATGQLYLWTMDGLSQASAASPTPGSVANLAWQIVPQ